MTLLDKLYLAFLVGLVVVVGVTVFFVFRFRKSARSKPCRSCGYSMIGATSNVCPECGSEFDPSDRRPYVGRSRAWVRSLAIVFFAAASTFVVAQARLPMYGVLSASMSWTMQSVVGDSSSLKMRVVGRSSQEGWSSTLDVDVFPPLEELEFSWRGETLLVRRDAEAEEWVDADGEEIDAQGVLDRLNCTEIPESQVDALLTMNWSDGELRSFLETETFDDPSEYGDRDITTVPHFMRNRYRFHYAGGGASLNEYSVGLYIAWALIWFTAITLIVLSFWVDRRKPSRRKAEATLPA